jgi:hypothetical protein
MDGSSIRTASNVIEDTQRERTPLAHARDLDPPRAGIDRVLH